MATLDPTPSMRPYLPIDAPVLADVFRLSIEVLTQDDYDEDQRAAWMSRVDDLVAFSARLAGALTLVAFVDGEAAGFANLKGADTIDMLYVHPEFARQGVATTLLDAIEKLAGARGAKQLTVDASDTARPLFAVRHYTAMSRNTVMVDGEWLANTTMTKSLVPASAPGVKS